MAELMTELWCYIEGQSSPFIITVLPNLAIHDLREKIVEENLHFFAQYRLSALSLTLTKVDADFNHVGKDICSRQYRPNVNDQWLRPWDRINAVWPRQPSLGHLHVFVGLPSGVLTADDAGAKPDDFDKLVGNTATSPLVCEAPSTVAMPHVFRKSQAKEGRILNDRPHKDVRVPPIALLYAPFGRFLDHMRDCPEEQPGVDLREFQLAVDEFASTMCEHFLDKDERRDEILPLLNAIFEIYHPFKLPRLVPAVIKGRFTSDGHAVGPAQLMETVVEVKNEFGSDHTDPEIQTTSYCLQVFHRRMTSGRFKNSFEKYLCPTLVITIIGSYIGFGALVLLDNARFVELTPLLPARSPSGDDINRSTLFQAFRAACVLRHNIHEDTQRVRNSTTLTRMHNRYLPYVQEIQAWPPSEDRQLEFRILGVTYQDEIWNENRFLFHAEAQDRNVLVKFTRRYCIELHEFCAMNRHASRLLGYGTVPGGWYVVVMEDVKHTHNHAEYAPRFWVKWCQDLNHLMHGFHDINLVHGDLRTANLVVPVNDPENIMLVDFDWGGEAGRVSFPTWSLNKDLINGDRLESLVITKEHDVRVLNVALERLKPVPAGTTMDMSL